MYEADRSKTCEICTFLMGHDVQLAGWGIASGLSAFHMTRLDQDHHSRTFSTGASQQLGTETWPESASMCSAVYGFGEWRGASSETRALTDLSANCRCWTSPPAYSVRRDSLEEAEVGADLAMMSLDRSTPTTRPVLPTRRTLSKSKSSARLSTLSP